MKNIKDVSPGTWARLALLILALVNSALTVFGVNPMPLSQGAENIISTVIIVLASGLAYWKNNSFTESAIVADRILSGLREMSEKQTNK